MLKMNEVNETKIEELKQAKVDRKGLGAKAIAIALASVTIVSTLTGCGGEQNANENTPTPSETPVVSTETPAPTETPTETEENVGLEVGNGFIIGANDTYTSSDWDSFVKSGLEVVSGKINNNNSARFEVALSVLNCEYLSNKGEKVLAEQYALGTDVESILNAYYSLTSQIREYNIEVGNVDEYLEMSSLLIDSRDQAIISQLESYAKEVIELRKDLTDANKARIQEIFDIVLAFANGTGTIEVTIDGKVETVAEIDLSRGGILAAENIAQTISVMSKDIVSQEERETLDGQLRSQDTLAKVQEIIIKYQTFGSMLYEINAETQAETQNDIFDNYTKGYSIILTDLKAMGCSEAEAKALYTLTNIDYFVDSTQSRNVLELIYANGIDINAMFKDAESAIAKIVEYNDSQESVDKVYDLARLSMASVEDAISLRQFARTAYNVTSENETVATDAVNCVKGYSQYSSDVTIDYQTTELDGTVVDHSLDKNALSKGATQVINLYTYYSVMNHKSVYGNYADAILPLVDGSQTGLSPYDSIVLMVEDHCADRNIVVYNYTMGEDTQGQK